MGFEVLAAIDLFGGRVVRLRQGDFDQATAYGDDPAAVAAGFVAAGIRWLHVVDLDGARAGRPVHGSEIAALLRAVEGRASVEVGGGIRDAAGAATLLDAGVDRVVLGTAALRDPALARELVGRFGAERVAVAIDIRDGRTLGEAWRAGATGDDPAAVVGRLADVGIRTFEVTAIDRDGTLEGPDLDRLRTLVELDAGAIVAAGGIGSSADVAAVRAVGCVGAIVGRAFYEGRLDPRDLAEIG
jgi:phosphoribosylformimino-5-aminoimidazole carboxamide ribotide isomerase